MLWFLVQKKTNQGDIPAESRMKGETISPNPLLFSNFPSRIFHACWGCWRMLQQQPAVFGIPTSLKCKEELTSPPFRDCSDCWETFYHMLRLIGAFWVIVFQVCRNFKSHPDKETLGIFRDHGFWDSRLRYDLLDTQWLHSGDKS